MSEDKKKVNRLLKELIEASPHMATLHATHERSKTLMKAGQDIALGAQLLLPIIAVQPSMKATFDMAMEAAVDCMDRAITLVKQHGAPPNITDNMEIDLRLTRAVAGISIPNEQEPEGEER